MLEVTKDEVDEYYSPGDFQVGQTMTLLGRRLLLCNCDNFTKDYFRRNHPDMELKPIVIPKDDTHQDTVRADRRFPVVGKPLPVFYHPLSTGDSSLQRVWDT